MWCGFELLWILGIISYLLSNGSTYCSLINIRYILYILLTGVGMEFMQIFLVIHLLPVRHRSNVTYVRTQKMLRNLLKNSTAVFIKVMTWCWERTIHISMVEEGEAKRSKFSCMKLIFLKIYWHKNCYIILITTCGLSKFNEQYSQ
jgi:hypothetical protein